MPFDSTASPHVRAALLNGAHNVAERQPETTQPIGVYIDLILPDVAADRRPSATPGTPFN
jgi:hypothetical protein